VTRPLGWLAPRFRYLDGIESLIPPPFFSPFPLFSPGASVGENCRRRRVYWAEPWPCARQIEASPRGPPKKERYYRDRSSRVRCLTSSRHTLLTYISNTSVTDMQAASKELTLFRESTAFELFPFGLPVSLSLDSERDVCGGVDVGKEITLCPSHSASIFGSKPA
jgi:hypothetical protein